MIRTETLSILSDDNFSISAHSIDSRETGLSSAQNSIDLDILYSSESSESLSPSKSQKKNLLNKSNKINEQVPEVFKNLARLI